VVVLIDCGLPLAFDRSHLFGVVVVVGECPIDIGHVEVVPIGDCSRFKPPLFDLFFEELNGDASAFEMRLVVEFLYDTSRYLAHTGRYAAIALERLYWTLTDFTFTETTSRNPPGGVPGSQMNRRPTGRSKPPGRRPAVTLGTAEPPRR